MIVDIATLLQIFFWSGTIMTVAARFLNIKKIWWCFILWIFGASAMCIQGITLNQWNIVGYQIVYICFNIWGLIEWRRDALKERGV